MIALQSLLKGNKQAAVPNLEAVGKWTSSTECRTVPHIFSDPWENMKQGGAYYLNFKSFSVVIKKKKIRL